jgi:hypothetical protein
MTVIEFRASPRHSIIGRFRAVDYGYDAADAIRLERKDDMRKRGLASPDDGDALGLTFAYPVERRNRQEDWRLQEKMAVLKRRIV